MLRHSVPAGRGEVASIEGSTPPAGGARALYLYDVEFMKFRVNLEPGQPNRAERIDPSPAVREDLSRFRREKLEPALAPALASREWDEFTENLRYANTTPELTSEIIDAYEMYRENREAARAAQALAEAEAAARGEE